MGAMRRLARRGNLWTEALLWLSLGCLALGLLLPVVRVRFFYLMGAEYSLLDGILAYFSAGTPGSLAIGALCLAFTVLLPAGKVLCGLWLCHAPHARRQRSRLLRWALSLSRWSMLDVFMVAIMVVAVDGRLFAAADLSIGVLFFAAAVLLSSFCLQRLERQAPSAKADQFSSTA